MKKHYSRYTLDKVSQITGCPTNQIEAIYKEFAKSGAKDKAVLSCMLWSHAAHLWQPEYPGLFHIAVPAGNMGIAGGGINALRAPPTFRVLPTRLLLWQYLPDIFLYRLILMSTWLLL